MPTFVIFNFFSTNALVIILVSLWFFWMFFERFHTSTEHSVSRCHVWVIHPQCIPQNCHWNSQAMGRLWDFGQKNPIMNKVKRVKKYHLYHKILFFSQCTVSVTPHIARLYSTCTGPMNKKKSLNVHPNTKSMESVKSPKKVTPIIQKSTLAGNLYWLLKF